MSVPKLPTASLRWRCDPAELGFSSTAQVEPFLGIGGQDDATEALRFGLEFDAPGQHVFVRGIQGVGRLTLVQCLLDESRRSVPPAGDRCYVHNFSEPERPRLIVLPRGEAERFRQAIDDLAGFITKELGPAIKTGTLREAAIRIDDEAETKMRELTDPLDADLAAAGLALMMAQVGNVTRPIIVPVVDGQPIPPDQIEAALEAGKMTTEEFEARMEQAQGFAARVEEVGEHAFEIRRERGEALRKVLQEDAARLLSQRLRPVRSRFPGVDVAVFLDELVDDVLTRRLATLEGASGFENLYRVNILITHRGDGPGSRVIESAPSVQSLLGSIELPAESEAELEAPHMWIHPGSILRADAGYLVVDARDLLTEPGAWQVLVRTLRTGSLDFTIPDTRTPFRGPVLKPEPIPVDVKVILIGEPEIYFALDSGDLDFPQLFKVLVDFDTVMPRTPATIELYARVLARIVREEELPPFDAGAVAALIEHGSRIAARREKLTARLARVADIAREASFLACKREADHVGAEDIRETVRRTKQRANLPARRFREAIANGSIRINTTGTAVGQINGLAVMSAGPLTYGFPTRISATAAPGSGGAVNIEGEAQLSGAIHTKSHFILGGLLRNLLGLDHPLVFDASIAFEQSYGGIDGDSASGAALCCLLSALTGHPVRQDLAMTGAIDQVGNVLPIGAVNEKIEGFFDVCLAGGLSKTQGVIIPAANVGDLMLRQDVVEACEMGEFAVYAVDDIHQALELFFETEPGQRQADGSYPPGSVLAEAVERAHAFWRVACQVRN